MKKYISLVLCVVFFFCFMQTAFAFPAEDEIYDGQFIEFGSYPQTHITDEVLIAELNGELEGCEWTSLGFCADKKVSDYGQYCDIDYMGERYRAVYYSGTRPVYASNHINGDGYQTINGYPAGTVYWFLFEPIEWIVADKESGMLICARALESQAINDIYYVDNSICYADEAHTVYANNYAKSSIRERLNGDFYLNAFSDSQKAMIKTTEVVNNAYYEEFSQYAGETVYDKVFIPSLDDLNNCSYEFEQDSFRMLLTDYCRMLGYSDYSYNGGDYLYFAFWFLRTPGTTSESMFYFSPAGNCGIGIDARGCDTGIVPCICVDFSQAEEDDGTDPENGLLYSYEDDVLTISFPGEGDAPAVSGTETLAQYCNARSLVIDVDVTAVDDYAFEGFDSLKTVLFGGDITVGDSAFGSCRNLRDVYCLGSIEADGKSFPVCDIYADASDNLHFGTSARARLHTVTRDGGALKVSGAVAMDTYRLFDAVAAFSVRYKDIFSLGFDVFTSTDIVFAYYDETSREYVEIEDSTLENAVFTVREKNGNEYVQISFNEMSKKAADGTLGDFILTATADGYGDINENPIEVTQEDNFFRQAIKFIVTMLNKLFSFFSKLFK